MNRVLTVINLVGVVVLAVVCACYWQVNRRVNLDKMALEKSGQELTHELADKEAAMRGQVADMESFRGQLEKSAGVLREAQEKIGALMGERDRLVAEGAALKAGNDALKEAVEKWTAAVMARDEALKQAQGQMQKLADERNDAIGKYNALATKFNAEVEQVREANGTIEKLTAERNEAVTKFNELAAKYNALVTASTKPRAVN